MISYVLEALRAPHEVDLEEGPKCEACLLGRAFTAGEVAEGVKAFFARLQPTFSVR